MEFLAYEELYSAPKSISKREPVKGTRESCSRNQIKGRSVLIPSYLRGLNSYKTVYPTAILLHNVEAEADPPTQRCHARHDGKAARSGLQSFVQ